MPRETIAGRKSFNIVCSPVLLYRVPLVVIPASGPLQENENVLTFYLAVLRNTVEQPDGQTRRG
jgi:hypothetical protein